MVNGSSIPSRALTIWRRLYTRFSLEPEPASVSPDVLKTIIPVTDVDELLKNTLTGSTDGDLTGSAGSYVPVHTVPDGKRWTLRNVHREASTGTSAVWVNVAGGNGFLTANGTGEEVVTGLAIKMNQLDTVGLRASGNGADGAIRLNIIYDEEDAF